MDVALAVLADYANISREGKLNIMGIFDTIFSPQFPATHPQAQLIIRFEADISEAETKKSLEIRLIDEDGKTLMTVPGEMVLGKAQAGEQLKSEGLVTMNNMVFPRAGRYEFKILVNGEHKATVPLKVLELPRAEKN